MTSLAPDHLATAEIERRVVAYLATQGVKPKGQVALSAMPIAENGGLDSLGIVQLAMFAGEEFGIEFADDDFVAENFETVGSLVRLIEARLSG